MSETISKSAEDTGKAAMNEVKQKAASPLIQRLERFGYIIKGVIYIVIGLLALELAIGAGGATTSPSSAIALIGKLPFGKVLLVLIAIGLAGYSLWGFVRAIFDPLRRGSDMKGLMARGGFLLSGITYGLLLIPTVLTLLNKPGAAAASQGNSSGIPTAWLSGPMGKFVIIAFGIFWIAAGAYQLIAASKEEYMRDLKTSAMNEQQFKTLTTLGKVGYAARGVVYATVGALILETIFKFGAPQAKGFDGALAALARGPYGEVLLGLVALGLMLFGAFSAYSSKWVQTNPHRGRRTS
jgi:hypothetical protein